MTYAIYDPIYNAIVDYPDLCRFEYFITHGREVDYSDYDSFIFYHAPCQDGFFAAAITKKAHQDRGFHPLCIPVTYANRDTLAADCARITKGKAVTIVDFSVSPLVFAEFAKTAASVNIYDHHSSVYEGEWCNGDIEKLPVIEGYAWGRNTNNGFNSISLSPVDGNARFFYEYDNTVSGAALVKKVIEFNNDCPLEVSEGLIAHFQDRDLFTKALPNTDLIYTYVSNQKWFIDGDIDKGIEFLMSNREYTREMAEDANVDLPFFVKARAYKEVYDNEIDRIIKETMVTGVIMGILVPMVTCDKKYSSDAATVLYRLFKNAPFVVCINPGKFVNEDYTLSLRRAKGAVISEDAMGWLRDVVCGIDPWISPEEFIDKEDGGLHLGILADELASRFIRANGGGHSCAAGITIPYSYMQN